MNRTKDELLLECIKQFEHIENVLGYNRLSTTRSLIDEINQALTIPAVSGQSEQLCDFLEWYDEKLTLEEREMDIKTYLDMKSHNCL